MAFRDIWLISNTEESNVETEKLSSSSALWTPPRVPRVDRWKCPLCRGGELAPANWYSTKKNAPFPPFSPSLPKITTPETSAGNGGPKANRNARLNVFDSINRANDNTHYFFPRRSRGIEFDCWLARNEPSNPCLLGRIYRVTFWRFASLMFYQGILI